MTFIKNIIKKVLKNHKGLQNYVFTVYKKYRYTKSIFSTLGFAFKGLFLMYNPSYKLTRGEQIKRIIKKTKVNIDKERYFAFSLDCYKILYSNKSIIENTTVDYELILNKSTNDMLLDCEKLSESEYKENKLLVIDSINIMVDKMIVELEKSNKDNKDILIKYFKNIKNGKVKTFEEALQRILFYNQLLWQTGHTLNGLGRLDKILGKYYKKDDKKSRELIKEFILSLHSYYWLKSSALLGDTGQVIILGGNESNSKYFCNELTYAFIEEMKKVQIPDPKLLLRISSKTPRDLLDIAVDCIKTGIGCPLFANDDVVVPKLIKFGYEKDDSYNYITSACWEPLIPTKSVEQNNILSIVFMKPFNKMFDIEDVSKFSNINDIVNCYKKYLKDYLLDFFEQLDNKEYEIDPLVSLFVPNCDVVLKDVTMGGAIYNNFGATTVSLANVINSLLNIQELVYKEKKYKLSELNDIRKNNFKEAESVLEDLKNTKLRFGIDNKNVYDLFNDITDFVNGILENKYNKKGGRLKIGFSAPTYIIESQDCKASFDGRCDGEPFIVHISSDVDSLAYTELFSFASKLDYTGNRFNGNVIDFMVSPSFIEANKEKFIDFIQMSIDVGFFEMQMNVISSETLIKARKNPELFPNLIVRVWGFSSYFNDLPDEYKDVLIERALKNEGKS